MIRAIAISLVAVACHSSSGSVAQDGDVIDVPRMIDSPPAIDAPPDAAVNDYNQDGPDSVTTFAVMVTTSGRAFTENVYLPGAAGSHPVVVLSPGLEQPAAAYHDYGHRLASYGIITLVRDDPGIVENSADVAADISYLVATWLPAANADASSMLAGHVDLAHVGLAGHSRGGKSSLIALELGAAGKVNAWFGLDPVDAAFINGGVQARDQLANIGIPTAFLGTSVVGVCNAVADSYQVLYADAPSPSVALTAVGAGHTQLEDPASCVSCAICAAGTADGQVVLAYSVRYLVAFFARELLGDSHVGPTFDGAGIASDIAAGLIQRVSK
jgi:dienelactone hydrolase